MLLLPVACHACVHAYDNYSRAEGRLSTTTQSESASKHDQEQEMAESDGVYSVISPALTTTGARQGETEDPNNTYMYELVKKAGDEGEADTDDTGVYEVTNY